MDLSTFKKPWVIYAGLGLGALILVSSLGKSSGGTPQSQAQTLSYQEAMNQAGMNFMQHQYDTSVAFEMTRFNADIQMQALAMASLMNIANVAGQQASQNSNVQAGISGQIIANNFALSADRAMMASRIAMMNVIPNSTSSPANTPQITEQNVTPSSTKGA